MTQEMTLPPDRHFGFLLAFCFTVLGFWLTWGGEFGQAVVWIMLSSAAFVVALVKPTLFRPFNWLWMKIGVFVGSIISPIILLLLFYVVIAPIALISKASGRNELSLKYHAGETYWENREPVERDEVWFSNQF